ncbi:MAG: DUF1015 domain-containing protein, partial [Bacteroidia bacterium]
SEENKIKSLEAAYKAMPSIYIADGHHRSASSALLGKSRRNKNKNYTGEESFNYYLGIFFPEDELQIFDYNRVVKDIGNYTSNEFIEQIEKSFTIEAISGKYFSPRKKHEISMYINYKWYALTPKSNTYDPNDPVGSLDAAILTKNILSPILGISDLRINKRIGFVPGIKGNAELKKQVDNGRFAVAFGLFPVSMNQLKWIADTGNIMPPKSTWVEPKMRSGLVIYEFD